MQLKITFVNPNTEKEVDKYLHKILVEGVINKIARDGQGVDFIDQYDERHSA